MSTPNLPPPTALRCRALSPLPFHLGVIVTQHQRPRSDQRWPGKGAGVHGWKESGGDIAEGQLGTLWTAAQKPVRKKARGEDGEKERREMTLRPLSLPRH